MKNLISIIEKLKIGSKTKISSEGINLLVELLIKIVLSKQGKINKDDFELYDEDDNIYTILNVPQDNKYWKEFYNEIIEYEDEFKFHGDPNDVVFPDDYFKVALKDDKHTFVVFNLNSDGLNSIDVTENIKNLILDKIK